MALLWLKLWGPCHLCAEKPRVSLFTELGKHAAKRLLLGAGPKLDRDPAAFEGWVLPSGCPARVAFLTWPQPQGCVHECFFWKQLLHKLHDRILASSALCTIIFCIKLPLLPSNNCFICCLLWHNWKHGWWWWFKNLAALEWKELELQSFALREFLYFWADLFGLVWDVEPADILAVWSSFLAFATKVSRSCSSRNSAESWPVNLPGSEEVPLGAGGHRQASDRGSNTGNCSPSPWMCSSVRSVVWRGC